MPTGREKKTSRGGDSDKPNSESKLKKKSRERVLKNANSWRQGKKTE